MENFFLPAVGYRDVSIGSLTWQGTTGNYWGAMRHNLSGTQFRVYSAFSDIVDAFSNELAFSIRCVRKSNTFFLPAVGFRVWSDSSLLGPGWQGNYVASTLLNDALAHQLVITSSDSEPASGAIKSYGFSVRCVR